MRIPGHRLDLPPAQGGSLRRLLRDALLACLALLALCGTARAREVTVLGAPMKGFVRIELRFDEPTRVGVRTSGGVMVVSFAERTRIREEQLVKEIAAAVSAVRRDPDGTGLRLALASPVRANLLEAGERVFIDLLPPQWAGLPPGLPPEVVAELAERARAAEARTRDEEARRAASRKPVRLRLAEVATTTRLVFEPAPGTAMRFKEAAEGILLTFDDVLGLDLAGLRPKAAAGVADFSATAENGRLSVRVAPAPDFKASAFTEDGTIVVDLATAARPRPGTIAGPPAPAPHDPAPTPHPAAPPGERRADHGPPEPVAAKPATGETPLPATPVPAPGPAPVQPRPAAGERAAPGTLVPKIDRTEGRRAILFPFASPVAAAAFQRGDGLTLLFDTRDGLDPATLASAIEGGPAKLEDVSREEGLILLRLGLPAATAPRLVAEGATWRLALDEAGALPPDEIRVSRGADANGSGQVVAALASPGAVHWIDEAGGLRLAVVTARGRASGIANGRRFAEFDLLASLQGVVVAARADDLAVGLGEAGATISRKAGLALSSAPASVGGRAGSPYLLDREGWQEDQSGSVLDRYRALVAAAAGAPRSGQAEARFRLARFALANGLASEAAGLLGLAGAEDPLFARRRASVLLSGIAALRAGRPAEARALLAQEALAEDPEAVLWRAALAARERQWAEARAGFRRSAEVLSHYADDLAGEMRLLALQAALELGEVAGAEAAMASLDRLPGGTVPRDRQDLARARLDELADRPLAALKTYRRLAEAADRPVAAEATLRAIRLAGRLGRLPPEGAIDQLQTLAVAWRGDEVEIGTFAELARLYAARGRWREMFTASRYADRVFPKHELTRALHDETARRFEALMLGEDGAGLLAVDMLALYYDFKDYAPIGRRGDEIVRRLADRLVELDLLDQAADLLQYQVDKRLAGAARATVAARLATIRLLAGKPLMALAALHGTRGGDLPAGARRFRLLLEAQAQADLTRVDLALETVEGEEGPDVARLRAAILFGARRWREAGEASEGLLGTRWQEAAPLSDRDRSDVVRAAIADLLANESLALDRLRSKFAAKMADSPDAKTFAVLMGPDVVTTPEFRTLVRQASRADQFRQLLEEWNASPSAAKEQAAEGEARPKAG